jgi:ABC-type glutathione transport system ATPase component
MTIEDNIRFTKPNATRDSVEEAAKLANAYNFIMKLPEGFNTKIGKQAMVLSGGEKQRLVIARAFLSRPKLLLLDEATSALDAVSENEVLSAIKAISTHCTCITVAHRLGTIKHAQNIVVMKDGVAIEHGNHEELCRNDTSYTVLWETSSATPALGKHEVTQQRNSENHITRTTTAQEEEEVKDNEKEEEKEENLSFDIPHVHRHHSLSRAQHIRSTISFRNRLEALQSIALTSQDHSLQKAVHDVVQSSHELLASDVDMTIPLNRAASIPALGLYRRDSV